VDYISKDPKIGKIIVGKKLAAIDNKGILPEVINSLDLESILEREV
jgi:translation initiation factor RLI1